MVKRLLCVGTNEGGLLGYNWNVEAVNANESEQEEKLQFHHVDEMDKLLEYEYDVDVICSTAFKFHASAESIRSLTQMDNTVLTAGYDEVIRTYDLANQREGSARFDHSSTVNAITTFKDGHGRSLCLSGAQNGELILWGSTSFEQALLKMQLPLNNPIIDIAVHKTGKLAIILTSSKLLDDGASSANKLPPQLFVISIEDMKVKGSMKLQNRDPIGILFSNSSEIYAVLYQSSVDIYRTGSSEPYKTFHRSSNIDLGIFSCINWPLEDTDNILFLGDTNGRLHVLDLTAHDDNKIELVFTVKQQISSNINHSSSFDDEEKNDEREQNGNNTILINNSHSRIKSILRADRNKEGIIHICAVTGDGTILFWAIDRNDLKKIRKLKKKREEIMHYFIKIKSEDIRVTCALIA